MSKYKQIDCFYINMQYWKVLGIYPYRKTSLQYFVYSLFIVMWGQLIYILLPTINFAYLPRVMDTFIEEAIFYFVELASLSKFLTLFLMKEKILKIFDILESDRFQPKTDFGKKIMEDAKNFNVCYWKINACISYISHLTHILSPVFAHIVVGAPLFLPLCSYSFLSEGFIQDHIYYLYFYECFGMHLCMLSNVNIDSFILALIILIIAQIDIVDGNLKRVTEELIEVETNEPSNNRDREKLYLEKLNDCLKHFDEIAHFCELVQDVFSVTLFFQFSISSFIICICLFRFTMPAPNEYYIFLITYLIVMIVQIMVPCWFGTRIIVKTSNLSLAVYECDWPTRTRAFKTNLRLFCERVKKPLSITGMKMFPLSLATFTSIMNSAYSFFTLLRHMQTTDSEKL